MKTLETVEQNGTVYVRSRQVAEMVEKQHGHLMRDIKGYGTILAESNFGVSDFFVEATYQDSTGRSLPCYLITREGCDMVANKMTGEKGVRFTASYINTFYEMEKQLNKPITQLEVLAGVANELVKQDKKLSQLVSRADEQDKVLSKAVDSIHINDPQRCQLKSLVETMAAHHAMITGLSYRTIIGRIWKHTNYSCNVTAYHNIRSVDFEKAIKAVKDWNSDVVH